MCGGIHTLFKKNDEGITTKIFEQTPTQGFHRGRRLDRWIKILRPDGNEVLYQCEIKNWAASALGGQRLPIECDEQMLRNATTLAWERQLNEGFKNAKQPGIVTKVLLPMNVPEQFHDMPVEPLLLYWMPISNTPPIILNRIFHPQLRVFNCLKK